MRQETEEDGREGRDYSAKNAREKKKAFLPDNIGVYFQRGGSREKIQREKKGGKCHNFLITGELSLCLLWGGGIFSIILNGGYFFSLGGKGWGSREKKGESLVIRFFLLV